MDKCYTKPVEMVDVDLVQRCKRGDMVAFEELFDRYHKRVYNILYGLVGNEADAADLTQEVFVKVYNSLGSLRAEQAFFTWLKTVSVNVYRDYLRKLAPKTQSINEQISFDDDKFEKDYPDPSDGPEKMVINTQRDAIVRKALSTLSEEHRSVVVLHHFAGMELKDIAKTLGCPVGTIKSRLARSRDELKRKLGPFIDLD